MAEVTRTGNPSVASPHTAASDQCAGLLAGENLVAGDLVYIKASDGRLWKATGAAANEAARVVGMVQVGAKTGEAVTFWRNVRFGYGPKVASVAVVPGTPLFLSGTVAGGFADVASVGGTVVIAYVVDTDGRIQLKGL